MPAPIFFPVCPPALPHLMPAPTPATTLSHPAGMALRATLRVAKARPISQDKTSAVSAKRTGRLDYRDIEESFHLQIEATLPKMGGGGIGQRKAAGTHI
jgi:hypothetical protein